MTERSKYTYIHKDVSKSTQILWTFRKHANFKIETGFWCNLWTANIKIATHRLQ